MLCLNSTEAERARGCVFAENFESPMHVAKNRGTVTGTVPINFGATFSVVAGSKVTYPCGSLLNKLVISWVFDAIPYFAANDGLNRVLVSGPTFVVYKTAANTLDVIHGGVVVIGVPLANYQAYWLENKRNTFICSIISGTGVFFLNGVQVGTNAVAFTQTDEPTLYVGANAASALNWAGRILSVKLFTGRVAADMLTLAEARDYWFAG